MSLIAAEGLGRKIAAAASFHGGRLAVAGDPSSPHLAADRVTATVYVAGAKDDGSFTAEQAELLESTLTTPKRTPGTGKLSASSTGLTSNAPEAHATPAAAICGAVGGAADVAADAVRRGGAGCCGDTVVEAGGGVGALAHRRRRGVAARPQWPAFAVSVAGANPFRR